MGWAALLAGLGGVAVVWEGLPVRGPLGLAVNPFVNVLSVVVLATVAVWCETRLGARAWPVANALARGSYGIYFWHGFAMGCVSRMLPRMGRSLGAELLYWCVFAALTVALSWGIVRLMSLVPVLRYVSGSDRR
jgi:peptidoglycan/LPS O-acetylase OafA/YrhL